MSFDYTALAELYPTRSYKRRAGRVTYKRFEVAAEAVRFAMEELPSEFLLGLILRSKSKDSTAGKFASCTKGIKIFWSTVTRTVPSPAMRERLDRPRI